MSSPRVSVTEREWLWVLSLTLAILALAGAPYALAYSASGDRVFTGILINPFDGNSYFAKMQEGWRGDWLFTLPYTAQPGDGAFIFTYYLFLGHLARWAGGSLELTYHLARVFGGLCLLVTAYQFISRFFDSFRARLGVWLLFALGSGLGWVAVPFGAFTSDLWVAEFIPFLSIFANPHFPLAAALMLLIFEWTLPGLTAAPRSPRNWALTALAVTFLAQVQPLALPVVGVILGALTLHRMISARRLIIPEVVPLLVVGVSALPWFLYDLWVIRANPLLRQWNAQNLTPSPVWWDALLSGGTPLLLALLGLIVAARRRTALDLVLATWFGLNMALLYAPLALQRRLSLGLWMPITLLAGVAVRDVIWPRLSGLWRPLALGVMAALVLPGNLLIYAATLSGIAKREPAIFLTRDEADALDWIAHNTQTDSLILAAPETSLFIPARSGRRVIYGHPFETVEAETHKQAVGDFFTSRIAPDEFLARYPVDFIFYGPREKTLGPLPALDGWRTVFQQGEVTVYGR